MDDAIAGCVRWVAGNDRLRGGGQRIDVGRLRRRGLGGAGGRRFLGRSSSLLGFGGWGREGDGLREREIVREVAQDLLRRLRGALQLFDFCEGVVQSGLAGALAGAGGVEDLLLRGEGGLEALLFVARREPGVDGERGDE